MAGLPGSTTSESPDDWLRSPSAGSHASPVPTSSAAAPYSGHVYDTPGSSRQAQPHHAPTSFSTPLEQISSALDTIQLDSGLGADSPETTMLSPPQAYGAAQTSGNGEMGSVSGAGGGGDEERTEAVHFVLLAEFDIDQGSTLAYQYPYPTGTDEHRLAELMLPDGAHLRSEDWTIFYLGQDHQLAIDPMLAHEVTSTVDKRASMFLPSERPKRGAVGGGLLYVLSCVRCKEDKSVKRGALVKSLSICTPMPWIHVFKPVLLLALEEYFQNPSPEILEHLYDCCNSAQLLALPQLTRAEKILMRQSDRKDLFEARYDAASAHARVLEVEAAELAGEMMRKDSSSSSGLVAPSTAGTAMGRLTPERKGMRDTHVFEADVRFRKIHVPMKMPVATFEEEVGDYSLVELISTFSNHPPFPGPFHPHLHTNGAATHPIILLINALLAHKRVLVLGTQFPAHSVARAVLGVCALGTGCGQVLRGITETALPYCNLSCYEMLEGMNGFIAGVTNPRFVDLPCWDVCCDIETGRVTVNKNMRGDVVADASELSLNTIRDDPATTGSGQGQGQAGKSSQRTDCVDNQFMDEISAAIGSHYGEMYVRRRMTDYISRFTRLAAYQEYTHHGSTRVGYPSRAYDGELGSGTVFADEGMKQREMRVNAARIDAWRKTKGYRLYVKDWAKEVSLRGLPFDVQHQVARLRNGTIGDAEAECIFSTLAVALQTPEHVLELLIHCPPHLGGLTPIANGLYHRWPMVREAALDVLLNVQMHPAGRHAVVALNYFQRKTYLQLVERRQPAVPDPDPDPDPTHEQHVYQNSGLGQGFDADQQQQARSPESVEHGYGFSPDFSRETREVMA